MAWQGCLARLDLVLQDERASSGSGKNDADAHLYLLSSV